MAPKNFGKKGGPSKGPQPPTTPVSALAHRPAACPTCSRPGHVANDCPYNDDPPWCSNCGKQEHKCSSCNRGCQVPGCQTPGQHFTWAHPDPNSDLSAHDRQSIHGLHAEKKSKDALENPVGEPIYMNEQDQRTKIPRPDTEYASHRCDTDSHVLDKNNPSSVVTNYIRVQCKLNRVYVYELVIADVPAPAQSANSSAAGQAQPANIAAATPIKRRGERKRVFEVVLGLPPLQGRGDYATDYTTVWLGAPLGQAGTVVAFNNVVYHKQSGKAVTVPYVELRPRVNGQLDFSRGTADLVGPVSNNHNPNELIRGLNAMITRCVTSSRAGTLFDFGSNMFFVKGSEVDVKNVYIQRGYFTSIRPGEKSVLLNVNITHGAFLKPMKVSDFIDEFGRGHKFAQDYGNAYNLLKGRTVRIIYDRPTGKDGVSKNNNRQKVICGFGDVPQVQQFESEGRMYTVKEWFELQNIQINRIDLSCANVGLPPDPDTGKKRAVWIPCELLELEPDQPFGKQLGSTHMDLMKTVALQHPASNHIAIEEEGLGLLGVRDAQQPLQQHLQISAGQHLMRIPASQLKAPIIEYRDDKGKQLTRANILGASWNLAGVTFLNPSAKISAPLAVLDLRSNRSQSPTPEVIAERWLRQCKVHGLLKAAPAKDQAKAITHRIAVPDLKNPSSYKILSDSITKAVEDFKTKHDSRLAVVLLEAKDATQYAAVKRIADTQLGIHTICVTHNKIQKDDPSTMSNLLLKQNLKAGGRNHGVLNSDGKSAFTALGNDTLVLGVDVVHPGGVTPSIAAMVGSTDETQATFLGHVRLQPARQEVLTPQNMREMVTQCINTFGATTRKVPRRILYYRDGVGEDQFDEVLATEVPAIEAAFNALGRDKNWSKLSITAVIAGKRHHTRFFAPNDAMTYDVKYGQAPGHMDVSKSRKMETKYGGKTKTTYINAKNGNITPGLLVDQVITQPAVEGAYQDFFLQSHAALAGTAKSAHYVVIRNDKSTSGGPDINFRQIQHLTNAFCYNYARATKGVSYCSPAYYADRLCDRAHHYLRSILSTNNFHWQKTLTEKRNGDQGEVDFRRRVCDELTQHQDWLPTGQTEPWNPSLNTSMFWL